MGLSADLGGGGSLPQVGCKALAFPKQFKTQQYYNILKHICPEVEKAHPGFLRSQRWDVPAPSFPHTHPRGEGRRRLVSLQARPQSLTPHPPSPQAPRPDHRHLSGHPYAGDAAPGRRGGSGKQGSAHGRAPARPALPVLPRPRQHPVHLGKAEVAAPAPRLAGSPRDPSPRTRSHRGGQGCGHSSPGARPNCPLCPGKHQPLVPWSHGSLPWPSGPRPQGDAREGGPLL